MNYESNNKAFQALVDENKTPSLWDRIKNKQVKEELTSDRMTFIDDRPQATVSFQDYQSR